MFDQLQLKHVINGKDVLAVYPSLFHTWFVNVFSSDSLTMNPLVLPRLFLHDVIIQPGLFKGTYGDHGLELVLLTYDSDNQRIIVTKVTVSAFSLLLNLTDHSLL